MKLLTIAVPAYNVEKTLSDTLESFCIDELLESLDVIIVDDGSTDKTREIAKRFINSHPDSFRIISKKNGGHGSAVNTGIQNAAGRYFKVVDGDDRLEEDGFRALLKHLETTDSDLVATHYKKVPVDGGNPVPMRFESVLFNRQYSFGGLPADGSVYLGIHAVTYKTALLKDTGIRLQEHTFYVDVEYGLLPMPFVKTVEFLDVYTYLYFVGSAGQSINYDNFVKRYDHHYRVVKRMVKFAATPGLDEAVTDYVYSVLDKLCFTHYMLSAFYDRDVKRGKKRAAEFDAWLSASSPRLYRELGKSKYIRFLRATRFTVLPRGKALKKAVKSVSGSLKQLFGRKGRFTY
ncbi:MAG TPA: glycosyltransferase family 2 protein [Clostridia bacterium]|nr:glycosyltransferase family 2 protein [Clostridia bacterium]